jgi:oxygen-independent coproporphyrinogen-3 oxidase
VNRIVTSPKESIGLYVHLPFCRVRCSYCAFAISTDSDLELPYVEALLSEIDARKPARPVESVYYGGGTPSRLGAPLFDRLSNRIRELAGAAQEVTLEANPEDVTEERLEAWKSAGVTRVSLGVQSISDSELMPLGRLHGAAVARRAVELTVASGLRATCDVILGLPGQTRESFRETLAWLADSGVGHISSYMLDMEEGTFLAKQVDRGVVRLPEEDDVADTYLFMVGELTRHGFEQYEISNFAQPGERSIHNLNYWQRGEYLGAGLGAHSFLDGVRSANTRAIREYIDKWSRGESSIVFTEEPDVEETKHERLFLSLRQAGGIEYSELIELSGKEGEAWTERGLAGGWLRRNGSRVAFTPAGFVLSNSYISELF